MEETQKIFEPTPIDRDATLVAAERDGTLATPRFDEVEAQVARPVVPLQDNGGGGSSGRSPKRRRQWPVALVLISALAGGVVSLLAFRLYQQRQSQVAATETTNQQTINAAPTPETTPLAETPAVTQEQAQSGTPLIFEEFDPAKEGVEISDADSPRKPEMEAKPAAGARRDDSKAATTVTAPRSVEARPSRTESGSAAPRQVEARHDDERMRGDERTDEDTIIERRERRRQQREQRREERRAAPKRNIDRIKDIFEGAPPA